ncbi:glycoside hydrolase family 125 protein [Parathielavia appendiculata]|uniref:Glycoside hydrolase family 125 protein n=1 Tax=Parathielavia appendiculata TaxID=2587402 RepID=A0AAN6TST6_9PEZI|nr:glycoside hydrolase family 125 protein [Parathielavia appendiculata]
MKPSQIQILLAGLLVDVVSSQAPKCPDYSIYSKSRHEPFSSGKHALSSARPAPSCRTFNSTTVETLLSNMTLALADPDLYRLFENTYPNTLDTAIRWRGHAADNRAEELAFIITGDIDAMWLRDSANQLQSYLALVEPDPAAANQPDSIASLYRGVINLQARYLLTAPFCNSFQPPPESGIPPASNPAAASDIVFPTYDKSAVFECKYELDSLAAFLQLSTDYYETTHDADFFGKFLWLEALQAVLETAKSMTAPTYDPDTGAVLPSAYTFTRQTTRSTETMANDGLGSPVRETGMIRSAFRPSDDATMLQFLVPANMMFARYLGSAKLIVDALADRAPAGLADEMAAFSTSIREAVTKHGIVPVVSTNGSGVETVYAYEVDGYGGAVVMDDANLPSLLAAPLSGDLSNIDPVYVRTRARLLSADGNPYFMKGSVLDAIGGPHAGPGMAWPMASIVRILTSNDDEEIVRVLRELIGSTDGLGLMHESVNSNNASQWTRQWFSWANGLFGQMILDLRVRKPHILQQSFQ